MANPLTIALGKLVQAAARLKGGAGSAFPGLVVEKIEPAFAVDVLRRLPHGVVVISGTNGKTTTTRIVAELLRSQGLRVFTNATGSNFMRGVIAALLSQITLGGRLDADIAVLELDEAHATHFVQRVAPRHTLLLNVMRDQLDRFGEIDHTADLLAFVARHTTEAVVLNREDGRLARFASREDLREAPARLVWYGLAPALLSRFPSDDELYDEGTQGTRGTQGDGSFVLPKESRGRYGGTKEPSPCVPKEPSPCVPPCVPSPCVPACVPAGTLEPEALVTLDALDSGRATYVVDGRPFQTALELKGVYNAYNAAAALALVHVVLGEAAPTAQIVDCLATVKSAFGRGESFTVEGRMLEMVLVKNPGGFRLALASFEAAGHDTMIAINDEYADGRDMSWLFDVGFSTLRDEGAAMLSGTRAWDMALRLCYDEVPFAQVDTELGRALDRFIEGSTRPMRLYCTYTAMLRCRSHLAAYTAVSKVE
ncbi:MAG: MurT ligase domain-containing protein [Coriobacteriales bacterium]|nr:MurT ligase domain-containing protein [Coriobacteriales bacterium]